MLSGESRVILELIHCAIETKNHFVLSYRLFQQGTALFLDALYHTLFSSFCA